LLCVATAVIFSVERVNGGKWGAGVRGWRGSG
jgi:hypothetical protein